MVIRAAVELCGRPLSGAVVRWNRAQIPVLRPGPVVEEGKNVADGTGEFMSGAARQSLQRDGGQGAPDDDAQRDGEKHPPAKSATRNHVQPGKFVILMK